MDFPGLAELSTQDIHELFENNDVQYVSRLGGAAGIAKILGVDLISGNKQSNLEEIFGRNTTPEKPSPTFLHFLWNAYQDKTLLLLSGAAVVSLIIGVYEQLAMGKRGWIEGVAIIIAILIVVFVNALNDYQREKRFRVLSAKVKDRMVTIWRDHHEQRISVFDLTVGDLLIFEPGEVIPADGILVEGHKVTIDESGMTGESDAVRKDVESRPLLLSGTRVIDGSGRMLILATGIHSTQGKLMAALESDSTPTPLQQKLDHLAERIAKAGAAAALFMVLSLTVKYTIVHYLQKDWPDSGTILHNILNIMIQAVTVIVVAVPEGLPMAVTMALAFATTQMLKDNNLVRVMASCETMGAATTICSDKTGTMTENKMTVVKFKIANIEGGRDTQPVNFDKNVSTIMSDGIAINSTAFNTPNGWIGSKTEVALLNFAASVLHQPNYQSLREHARIIQRVPFSSERKFMTTAVEAFSDEGRPIGRIYLKGASEVVLAKSNRMIDRNGRVVDIAADDARDSIQSCISRYASEALRTIGIAYQDIMDTNLFSKMCSDPELLEQQSDFIWMGLVGIEDPLHDGVKEAVKRCRKAGILVRMVTGDNLETAKAIAVKANILDPNGLVMEGSQFRILTEEQQEKMIPKLQVLARSSPLDKQILVKKLRQYGQIVAVTGDGTNDGPALKAAHVGFSMGIAGTEVAKEASAIVLLDDNFTSIVRAVSWGRSVNESVRKFLQFQLSVNLTAVVTAAVSALVDPSEESVLTAVQLLWVNLIMDTFAALALATDPPRDDILDKPPDKPTAGLISTFMAVMICCQSIVQIAIMLSLQMLGARFIENREELRTFIFNTFIFLQMFNEINCRNVDSSFNVLRGISRNPYFVMIWLFTLAAQVILIQFGGKAFRTVPISPKLWMISITIGLISIIVGVLVRLFIKMSTQSTAALARTERISATENWQRAYVNVQRNRAFYNAIRREYQQRLVNQTNTKDGQI